MTDCIVAAFARYGYSWLAPWYSSSHCGQVAVPGVQASNSTSATQWLLVPILRKLLISFYMFMYFHTCSPCLVENDGSRVLLHFSMTWLENKAFRFRPVYYKEDGRPILQIQPVPSLDINRSLNREMYSTIFYPASCKEMWVNTSTHKVPCKNETSDFPCPILSQYLNWFQRTRTCSSGEDYQQNTPWFPTWSANSTHLAKSLDIGQR